MELIALLVFIASCIKLGFNVKNFDLKRQGYEPISDTTINLVIALALIMTLAVIAAITMLIINIIKKRNRIKQSHSSESQYQQG